VCRLKWELRVPLDPSTCFREYRAVVYRWALGLCGRHEDALDVVQEVFTRLVRTRPELPQPRQALAWLRRTTARVAIDAWRSSTARRERELSSRAPRSSEPSAEIREQLEHVRAAIGELSEQQRLVLLSKVYDNATFQEIAEELGLALSTVKTHYLRALSSVRERLSEAPQAGARPRRSAPAAAGGSSRKAASGSRTGAES
jgi:RNA polymerase sigma-70 factor (ECF subfamily)